jgi:D-3-phosphoglycerate dehydrogenase
MALFKRLGPFFGLAEKIGRLLAQLAPGGVDEIKVEYMGPVSEGQEPLTVALLKGVLSRSDESVNFVNATHVAKERGIRVARSTKSDEGDYTNLIRALLVCGGEAVSVAGTLFSDRHARIVEINGQSFDVRPEGVLLIVTNRDVPGVVGKIGTILGDKRVNIAEYQLGRREKGQEALSAISLDGEAGRDVLDALEALPEVLGVKQVEL